MVTESGLEIAPVVDIAEELDEADAAIDDGLEARLRDDPHSFRFFQLVRILERLSPERARVGDFGDPTKEVARFTVEPFISFPASEVQALELDDEGPARVAVNFMGLTGPQGVLPYDYTLLAAERRRARDRAPGEFFDIFHHRIISLFYRAWERGQVTVAPEGESEHRLGEHLLDLVGLGLGSLQGSLEVPDAVFTYYAGLLGPQQRSAAALEQILEDYFQVPVEVEQFIGGWYPLATSSRSSIGEETESEVLGDGAVIGDEIWDQQSRVRIRIGPLDREGYERFLPSGDAYAELGALVRFYCDDRFDLEIQPVLAKEEVPRCVLSADVHAVPLGWSSWMRSGDFTRDADDAILEL